MWIFIGFQQRAVKNSQNLKNDTFCRLPVSSCQSIFVSEKCPGRSILLNYVDDDYSRGYGQINEIFRALAKNDILQPVRDFRASNIRADDVGYNLYVLYLRYQQNFTASQPNEVVL